MRKSVSFDEVSQRPRLVAHPRISVATLVTLSTLSAQTVLVAYTHEKNLYDRTSTPVSSLTPSDISNLLEMRHEMNRISLLLARRRIALEREQYSLSGMHSRSYLSDLQGDLQFAQPPRATYPSRFLPIQQPAFFSSASLAGNDWLLHDQPLRNGHTTQNGQSGGGGVKRSDSPPHPAPSPNQVPRPESNVYSMATQFHQNTTMQHTLSATTHPRDIFSTATPPRSPSDVLWNPVLHVLLGHPRSASLESASSPVEAGAPALCSAPSSPSADSVSSVTSALYEGWWAEESAGMIRRGVAGGGMKGLFDAGVSTSTPAAAAAVTVAAPVTCELKKGGCGFGAVGSSRLRRGLATQELRQMEGVDDGYSVFGGTKGFLFDFYKSLEEKAECDATSVQRKGHHHYESNADVYLSQRVQGLDV
ncbi:hypothetical protein BC830DRAFT_337848 [Chytriomyces sp. MP71]|nr:hypothetical protein BC830DRAFT_337848 [Chytriomyces sp. MP71]